MPNLRQFKLPDVGEGLTEGEILSWLVAVGDTVTVNQPLCEVEPAKAVLSLHEWSTHDTEPKARAKHPKYALPFVAEAHRVVKHALTDGSAVDFASCHTCEHKTWTESGTGLDVSEVLKKAQKTKP